MSKNGWEAGDLKIPSKAWAGLKAAVREAYNKHQEAEFMLALALYHYVSEKTKGIRNKGEQLDRIIDDALRTGFLAPKSALDDKAFDATKLGRFRGYGNVVNTHGLGDSAWETIESLLLVADGKPPRLRKPLKKDWPLATNKTRDFHVSEEGTVSFSDDKTKVAHWGVCENNHAVDRARNGAVGKAFFAALGRIEWTRGTGGEITGNDEFNEGDGYGRGDNYVSGRFGPLGEPIRLPRRRKRRAA